MSFLESILLLQSILFPNLHLESSWPTSAITWIWWILTWLGQKQYLQRNDYNLSINSQGMLKGCSPCSPLFGAEGWRGNIAIIVVIIIIIIIITRVHFALLQVIMSWCHQTPGPHTELKTLKLVRLVWIPCLFLSRMTLVVLAHCKIAGRWVLVTDRHTPCQSYLVIIGFIQGTVFAALLTFFHGMWHWLINGGVFLCPSNVPISIVRISVCTQRAEPMNPELGIVNRC